MKYVLVAVLFVISGIAGNLLAGWLQKDVLLNVFDRKRIIASLIIAAGATLLGIYLQESLSSGERDVSTTVLSPTPHSSTTDPAKTPLLISGQLIPEPGVDVSFSQNPVQDETAVYPQIPAFYPQVSTVEMQIESLQETKNIRLSKPALLLISDFAQSETKQVYVGFPMGGWGYYHDFTTKLSPEFKGKVLEATRIENTDSQQEEIAGYNIYPGDVEVFKFHLNFLQPGIYVFDIGLEYIFQGQRRRLWVPESFTIQVPETYYVRDWMTGTYSETTFAELFAGF